MSEDIRSKLDAFLLNITKKIENKQFLPDIQLEYSEILEFLDKFEILKTEEFEALEEAMKKYELSKKRYEEQIKSYKLQKKADDEKIKNLKDEINKIINLEEQYKILNNDYNILKNKYEKENIENTEHIQKNKNNEKLIAELQGEITKLKNDNYEKDNKIVEFEKEQKTI